MFKKLVRVFANAFNNNSSRNNAATSSRPQPPAYKPSYLQQLETPALSTGLVFGKSLEDLERDEQNVPIVMNAFIKFAEMKKVIETQGIYRISGAVGYIQELKTRLDQNESIDFNELPQEKLHSILGCFKKFINEIKGGLIPDVFIKPLIEAQETHENLLSVIETLPELNKFALKALLYHLLNVASPEMYNSMNLLNLAKLYSGPIFSTADPIKLATVIREQKSRVMENSIAKTVLLAAGTLGESDLMVMSAMLTLLLFDILKACQYQLSLPVTAKDVIDGASVEDSAKDSATEMPKTDSAIGELNSSSSSSSSSWASSSTPSISELVSLGRDEKAIELRKAKRQIYKMSTRSFFYLDESIKRKFLLVRMKSCSSIGSMKSNGSSNSSAQSTPRRKGRSKTKPQMKAAAPIETALIQKKPETLQLQATKAEVNLQQLANAFLEHGYNRIRVDNSQVCIYGRDKQLVTFKLSPNLLQTILQHNDAISLITLLKKELQLQQTLCVSSKRITEIKPIAAQRLLIQDSNEDISNSGVCCDLVHEQVDLREGQQQQQQQEQQKKGKSLHKKLSKLVKKTKKASKKAAQYCLTGFIAFGQLAAMNPNNVAGVPLGF